MNTFQAFWNLRLAQESDIPSLEQLIPLSVRSLQSSYYSPAQMEASLGPVFGVNRQVIRDGTYFVVEKNCQIIACGGWSKRKSLFGGDKHQPDASVELNPATDPARVRAFFVHPDYARRGIGRQLLIECENAIRKEGFTRIELVATLAGEPLYLAGGYVVQERYELQLPNNLTLPVVRMVKIV
jgi:GNAT superfamily N-acetyltransferase